MHTNPETLGDIIKYYREKSDYTVEELANKVEISERYLYRIENEGKKPSYDVLYKLIRNLSIPPETIFFPEMRSKNYDKIAIINALNLFDKSQIKTIEMIINLLTRL